MLKHSLVRHSSIPCIAALVLGLMAEVTHGQGTQKSIKFNVGNDRSLPVGMAQKWMKMIADAGADGVRLVSNPDQPVRLTEDKFKSKSTVQVFAKIDKRQNLSITTLAFFQKFNGENQQFDEIGLQPTLFWNVSNNFSLGPSIYYNSFAGLSERISARVILKSLNLSAVLMSTVAHSEQNNNIYTEGFAQIQYNKVLSKNLSLWLIGQFLTIWNDFKVHSRSYQQLRIGMSLSDHQIGIGLDLDQYGSRPIEKSSYGIYYRKNL